MSTGGSAGGAAPATVPSPGPAKGKVVVPATPYVGEAGKAVPATGVKPVGGIKDDVANAAAAAAALGVAGLTALTALAGRSGYQVPTVQATQVVGGAQAADPSKAGEAVAAKPVAVGAKRPAAEGAEGATGEEGDPKKRKKLYPCEICGVVLKSFGGHTGHMLGHSGEKPHSCKVCQKAFRHVNALRNHERIHSGIKPYKCDQCEKCFVEQVNAPAHSAPPGPKNYFFLLPVHVRRMVRPNAQLANPPPPDLNLSCPHTAGPAQEPPAGSLGLEAARLHRGGLRFQDANCRQFEGAPKDAL